MVLGLFHGSYSSGKGLERIGLLPAKPAYPVDDAADFLLPGSRSGFLGHILRLGNHSHPEQNWRLMEDGHPLRSGRPPRIAATCPFCQAARARQRPPRLLSAGLTANRSFLGPSHPPPTLSMGANRQMPPQWRHLLGMEQACIGRGRRSERNRSTLHKSPSSWAGGLHMQGSLWTEWKKRGRDRGPALP